MTALRNAAQQALEALLTYEQYIQPLTNVFGGPRVPEEGSASAKVDAAITALRAALAEPVQEPVQEHEDWCASVTQLLLCDPPRKAPCNCKKKVAEPVQEPVAWRFQSAVGGWAYGSRPPVGSKYPVFSLYAAPPQRKPLPASDIVTMYDEHPMGDSDMIEFARAIERAHGIGEKP